MTGWACARCGAPVGAARYDLWCTHCWDNVIAIEDHTAPELASPVQRAAVRYLYKHHGLHSTPWLLRDLSQRAGRAIPDLRQLTEAEYRAILPALRKWSYGQ